MEVGFLIRVCRNYSRRKSGSLLSEEAEIPSTQSFVLTKRACSTTYERPHPTFGCLDVNMMFNHVASLILYLSKGLFDSEKDKVVTCALYM